MQNLPSDYVKKTETFNGGQIYWLFEPSREILEDWERRITCALCFTKKIFLENGVDLPNIAYLCYISSSFIETKSVLYEVSGGKFILQPNAASAVVRGALFSQQKTLPFMDVHEYIHIIMDELQAKESPQNKKGGKFNQPMWFREGLPQYIQGKKDEVDYFTLARRIDYLPPFVLELMNQPTEKLWFEFGIMDQLVATGNHPGLTACASFIQFLVEKERLGFKQVWNLAFFRGSLIDFYREIERLCQNSLFNILNNYLYYLDKPFLSLDGKIWSMPVAVARDFRGEFTYKEKAFKLLEILRSQGLAKQSFTNQNE